SRLVSPRPSPSTVPPFTMLLSSLISPLFFFNDTATTEIYTLSLHDALPIYPASRTPDHHDFGAGELMTEHSTEPPRRTVAIIDDHEMFRTGVRAEIEQHVDVVGEAGDVDSALELLGREQPDVVLLDVHMPGGGGIEVIRRHRSASSKFL